MSFVVNAAPLYGFDSDGKMSVIGEIDDSGNETLYEEEVPEDGVPGALDAVPEMPEDILEGVLPVPETSLDEPAADFDGVAPAVSYAAETFAVNSDFCPDSCIQFDATLGRFSGILMIPTSYKESIFVDDAGILWNVGPSNVVGRLFTSRSVSTGDYEQYIVTVSSCLANTASSVYNNGSMTKLTHYYMSGGRISNDEYYGDVTVTDDLSTYSGDQDFLRNIYLLIIIFILLGGGIICFSKHSKN